MNLFDQNILRPTLVLMQIIENIRLRFNDWFIGFIIKNEEKIMENEMKKYKKKQKKEEEEGKRKREKQRR